MSTCAKTQSAFLQRVIPFYRLGSVAVASKFVDSNDTIAYNTTEWRQAICRLYRNLLILHQVHIENPVQREFGDRFLGTEFRRGKQLDESHALKFYKGWLEYGLMVEQGAAKRGKSLTEDQVGMLNDEQKGNLTEFRSKVLETKHNPDVPGGIRD